MDADAISRAEYESALASLTVSEAQLESIEADIRRQSSSLAADLAELEFTNIYAPVSGTVVSVAASEGQTLNANQTAPTILSIADLTDMTVETDVSEADVLKVFQGQDAYFTTLGDSDTRWQTTVRQVLPTPEVVCVPQGSNGATLSTPSAGTVIAHSQAPRPQTLQASLRRAAFSVSTPHFFIDTLSKLRR